MIEYYTDGSAVPNPGLGGYAVIKDGRPYLIGSEPEGSPVSNTHTTNIRMEAQGLITALRDAAGQPCKIYTDSQFWVNTLTKWAPGWAQNGWAKKGGEIKNLDLVKKLYGLYSSSQAKLIWNYGHHGQMLNEMADEWANKARAGHIRDAITIDKLDPYIAQRKQSHAVTKYNVSSYHDPDKPIPKPWAKISVKPKTTDLGGVDGPIGEIRLTLPVGFKDMPIIELRRGLDIQLTQKLIERGLM